MTLNEEEIQNKLEVLLKSDIKQKFTNPKIKSHAHEIEIAKILLKSENYKARRIDLINSIEGIDRATNFRFLKNRGLAVSIKKGNDAWLKLTKLGIEFFTILEEEEKQMMKEMSKSGKIKELKRLADNDLTRAFVLQSAINSAIGCAEAHIDCFKEDTEGSMVIDAAILNQLLENISATFDIIQEQTEGFIDAVATRPAIK